jgi:hypothetical protein
VRGSGGPAMTRSILRGNRAVDSFSSGGAAVHGPVTLDRCTVVDNVGSGGAAVQGAVAVESCIVRANVGGQCDPQAITTYCNVEGGVSGIGNFDADPLFHGAPGDLHLFPGSTCIDVGDPAAPLDADGSRADVGALPFEPLHCGAGCTGAVGLAICVANANSTGVGARLVGLGSALANADHLVLNVVGVPSPAAGYFLVSRQAGVSPLDGGSQGLLCLYGTVLRFNADVLTDRGTGVVSFRPRLGALPQGTVVVPGDRRYFQYWFRDANPGPTSNTSSALRVDFQ